MADAAGGNVVEQVTKHVDARVDVLEARFDERLNGIERLLKVLLTLLAALITGLLMGAQWHE